jgi:tetratricopeptide (TPR) repeat protein
LNSGILPEPIIVGRQNELAQLRQYLDSALKGKGSTVLLSGEAGAGKTRILDEFLKIARKKNVTVLYGWCLSDAAVPYFPFVEAFDSYSSSDEDEGAAVNQRTGLKSWLVETNQSEANQKLASSAPQVWKDQAFAAVTKELLFLTAKKPVILALEDIHWADSASLSLLHYLARQVSSERILILASFRSEELNAEGEGHRNPLSNLLLLMGREDLYREVKLSNLGVADVGRIAESMLSGSVQPELVEKITADSGGNPLFIVESLRMLYQQGNLVKQNGQWLLCGDYSGIPRKVKDVILRRLAGLKSAQRRILDFASVAGLKFDPELVTAAFSQDKVDVLCALDEIEKTTLLLHCDRDCCSFVHAKFREMLYEEIPPLLKKEYHLRIAERIEAENQGTEEFSASELAFHYAQAGNEEKAVKYALEAGQDALAKWSNQEAIKHFTYVLQTIRDDPEHFGEKAVALEGLGDAYAASNNFNQAAEKFEQLADNTRDVARLRALRKAMFAAFYKGDLQKLIALTQKAEENAAADRLESARVLDQKATIFGLQGQHVAALELEKEALKIFEEENSLPDAARCLIQSSFFSSTQGQLEKGIAFALRSLALYNELGDFRSQIEAFHYTGYNFDICMLSQEAHGFYAKVIEFNEKLKLDPYVILIATYVSWSMSLPPEDIADAISKTLKALEYSKKTDSYLFLGWIYDTLILQYTVAGDMAHAERYFGKLMSLPQEVFLDGTTKLWLGLAKPVYAAGKNQLEESEQLFRDYFEFIKANMPNPLMELLTRRAYAWALSKQGRVNEAKTQIEQVQKLIETTRKRFSHANVQASLMTFTHPEINQMFEIRLDLINVSKSQGSIVKVESLVVPGLKIIDVSPNCLVREGNVEVKDKTIKPFEVKTIRLTVKAAKPQEFHLNPSVTYVDNLGETITSSTRPFTITVQSIRNDPQNVGKISEFPEEGVVEHPVIEFELATDDARRAFDFLIAAFLEDYMRRKLLVEKSGWRTLMEMIKSTKLSKYSTYGSNGRGGQVISELKRIGIVDARVFPGERGRGGRVLKLRVMYEKESVRRQIDGEVLRFRKNR